MGERESQGCLEMESSEEKKIRESQHHRLTARTYLGVWVYMGSTPIAELSGCDILSKEEVVPEQLTAHRLREPMGLTFL